jgi:hypothetical protein
VLEAQGAPGGGGDDVGPIGWRTFLTVTLPREVGDPLTGSCSPTRARWASSAPSPWSPAYVADGPTRSPLHVEIPRRVRLHRSLRGRLVRPSCVGHPGGQEVRRVAGRAPAAARGLRGQEDAGRERLRPAVPRGSSHERRSPCLTKAPRRRRATRGGRVSFEAPLGASRPARTPRGRQVHGPPADRRPGPARRGSIAIGGRDAASTRPRAQRWGRLPGVRALPQHDREGGIGYGLRVRRRSKAEISGPLTGCST